MNSAKNEESRDSLALSKASGDLVALTHVYTSTLVLGFGALFGMLQGFARAGMISLPPWLDYYRMLTAHGVLMALVFTTFFITGLMTYATYTAIPRVRSTQLNWLGYCIMLSGTIMTLVTIISGNASVLYTFYAPLKAHPAFYFGATLLVAGTWFIAADIFLNVMWYKRQYPKRQIPLPAFICATTFVMWVIATLGVVAEMTLLIPWSLGWTTGIDVELTRMLFWYFGHPLVYFWIMGAYLIWYTMLPTTFNGRIFSDTLTRLAFILLLILSTPVGLHHQFLDPGISAGWKWVQSITTFGVVIPSFMTAFAMFATFEIAARKKQIRGLWPTLCMLPWSDHLFAGSVLGMVLFLFGGFGGIVNNSYSMDILVHNTMWIVGHFHITVGGPVALTFIGATYKLVPLLGGRRLFAPKLALFQLYVYFVGMSIMSAGMHIAGLLGAPRRTADVHYSASAVAAAWHPEMVMSALGGMLIACSIFIFIFVATATYFTPAVQPAQSIRLFATQDSESQPTMLDHLPQWGLLALVLAIAAYTGPLIQHFSEHVYLVPGLRTW